MARRTLFLRTSNTVLYRSQLGLWVAVQLVEAGRVRRHGVHRLWKNSRPVLHSVKVAALLSTEKCLWTSLKYFHIHLIERRPQKTGPPLLLRTRSPALLLIERFSSLLLLLLLQPILEIANSPKKKKRKKDRLILNRRNPS
jgi:hypothetical protein